MQCFSLIFPSLYSSRYTGELITKEKRLSKNEQQREEKCKRESGQGGCKKKLLDATSLSSYVRIDVKLEHKKNRLDLSNHSIWCILCNEFGIMQLQVL
jgi:hypothetical protein